MSISNLKKGKDFEVLTFFFFYLNESVSNFISMRGDIFS